MKLIVTLAIEVEVEKLEHWNASTIEEAAENQKKEIFMDEAESILSLLEVGEISSFDVKGVP